MRDPLLTRTQLLRAAGILLGILAVFFHRSLLLGEIFSPAGMLAFDPPWQGLFQPPRLNLQRSDDVFLSFPMLATHLQMLGQGLWPGWDPHKLAGMPGFWGGVNLGQLVYPLSWIFLLPPAADRLVWYALLRLLAAGIGMYLYLRQVRASDRASMFGAIAFMLSGVLIVWLSSPIPTVWVLLPWVLFATERLLSRPGVRNGVALAVFLGMQFLGSYVAQSFVLLLVWGAYCLYRLIQGSESGLASAFKRVFALACAFLASLFVGASALVPLFATLRESQLAARVAGTSFYPLYNAITYLVPNFFGNPAHGNWVAPAGNYCENVSYMGLIPLFLALAALGLAPRHRLLPFWLALALFCLAYQYGLPGAQQLGLLPGVRQIPPARWSAALATAVAVLSAFSLDSCSEQRKRLGPLYLGFALGALLLVGAAMAVAWPELAARGRLPYQATQLSWMLAVLGSFGLLLVLHGRNVIGAPALQLGAIALLVVDLGGIGIGFNPTVPRTLFYPETPGLRYLAAHAGQGRILPFERVLAGDVAGVYGLRTLTGYDVSGDQLYRRYLAEAGDRSLLAEHALTPNDYLFATTASGAAEPNVMRFNLDPTSPLLARLNTRYFLAPSRMGLFPFKLVSQTRQDAILGPLLKDGPWVQTFVASDSFTRLCLLVGTYARANSGKLLLELRAGSGATASQRISVATLRDNAWNTFELPRMPAGRYELKVTGESTRPANAVTLYRSSTDSYADGSLSQGGGEQGDLCFEVVKEAPGPLAAAYRGPDMTIYANPLPLAAAWFVSHARHVGSDAEALALMHADRAWPPRQVILTDGTPVSAPTRATGSVQLVEQTPSLIRLAVQATGNGYVVLSERYDRRWQAELDGRAVPLLRGDVILRALAVPGGTHGVTLRYHDPMVLASLVTSILSLLALSGLGLLAWLPKRKERRHV